MKKLILVMMMALISMVSIAAEQPAYLKDATITVTLKSGKIFTYSANEYMVVKRGASKPKLAEQKQEEKKIVVVEKQQKRLKHIVSGELLRSNAGLSTTTSGNKTEIETRKAIGVGLQYQYNIYEDLFLGGRVDTNGGAGVNVGIGF